MNPRNILCAVLLPLLAACSSSQSGNEPKITSSSTGSITDEMIGRRFPAMRLSVNTQDPKYGYTKTVPIKVGGGFGEGSHNVYRYLNALLGPKGEAVHYARVGTCCAFKSPNSPFDGAALLEVFTISQEGSSKSQRLYFNWYDTGDLQVPVGLTARAE